MHQKLSDRIDALTDLLHQQVDQINEGTDNKLDILSQQNNQKFAESALDVEEKCNDLERRSQIFTNNTVKNSLNKFQKSIGSGLRGGGGNTR